MTRIRTLQTIGDLIDAFGSAVNVAGAVESRRKPSSRDLKNLGIDPKQFDRIVR